MCCQVSRRFDPTREVWYGKVGKGKGQEWPKSLRGWPYGAFEGGGRVRIAG
jgi:hypothetical protein